MDPIEEIKSKIDIVDLISSYFPLKKTGRNFKALCPFHSEKTPSFMVSPERQVFKCFGCGIGGDIFTFVEKMEGVDFKEALQILADRAGVQLKPLDKKSQTKKDIYYKILELTCQFYQKILFSEIGKKPLEYLIKERNLTEDIIKKFRLGFAPRIGDALFKFLLKKGFNKEDLISLGLITEIKGELKDFFRNRIIFPIFNHVGKIVAFAGRALEGEPKYINSPNSLIYDKSKVLYGLNFAKKKIQESDRVIIVEGYMDTIASHMIKVENVVASSGTALGENQIKLLSRYSKNFSFAFDKDEAGELATQRAIDLISNEELEISVILIPDAKDPDECIKKSPELWKEAVKNPIDVTEFYFQTIFSKFSKPYDIRTKKKIASFLLPVIKKIPNRIEQTHFISRIAKELEVSEKVIEDELLKIKSEKNEDEIEIDSEVLDSSTFRKKLEEIILGIALVFPEFQKEIFEITDESDFTQEKYAVLYKNLNLYYNKKDEFNFLKFKETLQEYELKKLADLLYFLGENIEDPSTELKQALERLKRIKFEEKKKHYETLIQKAEREGNKDQLKKLLEEFQSFLNDAKKKNSKT